MPAICFGSISTLADTSELQRQAFNEAFAAHGLTWSWERDEYVTMLTTSGGARRIAQFAESTGETVDAAAVHATKSTIFQRRLAEAHLEPRPGVRETVAEARSSDLKVALVTTTSKANVAALLEALSPALAATDFDVIVDASSVESPKPDGAAYAYALAQLGEVADQAVAVEDNVDGVRAAAAAGLHCVAFPNENTLHHDFEVAAQQVDRLDLADLRQFITAA